MIGSTLDGFAIVTGAGSGIGQETAYFFAESGAAGVLFADINKSSAEKSAEKSKEFASHPKYQVIAFEVDTRNPDQVQSMIDAAVKQFGRIDYSIHSAGVDLKEYVPVQDTDVKAYTDIMDVNATGTYVCTRAAMKAMQGQEPRSFTTRNGTKDIARGSIVNVASVLAFGAVSGKVGYITSKHAQLGITKSAAQDAGPLNIRVNAVCPSWVRTAMFEGECEKIPGVDQFVKAIVPIGRPAEPEEVASAVGFLCSPGANYIHGTSLIIDAGLTLTVHL